MKTPEFWKEESIIGRLMAPLGWGYYTVSSLHRRWQQWRSKAEKLSAPIVCVGNVTAGGAGKTPTVRMLSTMLKIAGQEPHCISRGYGGLPHPTPARVNHQEHTAAEMGDEALLLAQTCPTWVCSDRQAAAKAAIGDGATLVLTDDGLQNPGFHKDISLLVMDSHYGIGNGKLLPAGPLREPLNKALQRCHGIILIGDGNYHPPTTLPVWRAKLNITTDLKEFKKQPVIAFAGIATPQKFFDGLRGAGLKIAEQIPFPDHHQYRSNELGQLLQKAEQHNAALLTTAKDYVKLSESFRQRCTVVDVKLQLQQPKEFLQWLEEQISYG